MAHIATLGELVLKEVQPESYVPACVLWSSGCEINCEHTERQVAGKRRAAVSNNCNWLLTSIKMNKYKKYAVTGISSDVREVVALSNSRFKSMFAGKKQIATFPKL